MRSCDEGRQQGESKEERKEDEASEGGSRKDILHTPSHSFIHLILVCTLHAAPRLCDGRHTHRRQLWTLGREGNALHDPVSRWRQARSQITAGGRRQTCRKAQNDVASSARVGLEVGLPRKSCFAKINRLFFETL